MAMTLVQADYYSTDMLRSGIIDTIVKESPLLQRMPFTSVVGNAYAYNRELALPSMAFQQVGGTWTEGTHTVTPKSATLKIVGGDVDVDQFLASTRSDQTDLEATVLEMKAKAFAHHFEYYSVYGNVGDDALSFDGFHAFIDDDATGQDVHSGSGTTGGALSMADLDAMIDLVRPGKPDFLMMTRRTRRNGSAYARTLTSPVNYDVDEFGRRIGFYDGIPILINDHQLDTETIADDAYALPTGGATSSIFAVKLGEDAVHAIHNGPVPTMDDVGLLETKDATRRRLKAYVALVLMGTTKIARLDGITDATWTA